MKRSLFQSFNIAAATLWTLHVVKSADTSFPLPEAEYKAIQNLFESTGGDHWSWEGGEGVPWNFSDGSAWRPCVEQWQGITCTFDAEGVAHVTELALMEMGLASTLPDSIGDLAWLEKMVLDDNALCGTIPTTMNKLTSLRVLSMNGNLLEGSLPDLSDLTDLIVLDVGTNQLTGPSPPWLEVLSKLTYFDLSNNQFTGPVNNNPVGTLGTMCCLDLSQSRLPGPLPSFLPPFDALNKNQEELAESGWLEKYYRDMTGVLSRFAYNLQAPFVVVDDI